MDTEGHGGDCCGCSHLMSFGPAPSPQDLAALDRILDRAKSQTDDGERGNGRYECGWSHLYEAVLTDQQMRGWAPELKKRGFRLGPRWFNSNSGNYCTMLFYNAHGPRGRNRVKAPYNW